MRFDIVAEFMRDLRPASFAGWTDEALEDYVEFHAKQRTLVIVTLEGELSGVLVAWGQDEPAHVPFAWQAHNPDGKYWWWDQYMSLTPDGALLLASGYTLLHPRCRIVPGLAMRHNRLKRYPAGWINNAFAKGIKLYGNQRQSTDSA